MHSLVTGGGGFLGRAIVEQLLARGDRVRCFSRSESPQVAALGAEVVRGDICEPAAVAAACAGIECVFHVAAIAGIGGPWQRFYETNTLGTENVLAGCRLHRVPRLVYTSSPSVTFAGHDQCGVAERQSPPDFLWLARNGCHYSRSKALAERAVLTANSPSLATCALRPHLIWGPRDPHLVPRLIERARAGRLRRVGSGKNVVDTIYVDNAAAAHLLAADVLGRHFPPAEAGSPSGRSPGGRAYFLSQGEPVNCWEWIDQLLALAGLPAVRKGIPFRFARAGGAVCEKVFAWSGSTREPPMTRFLAWQLASSHWFDISAARRDLGYQPLISTVEGMLRLAAWLKSQ